jgi:hypothetical protein
MRSFFARCEEEQRWVKNCRASSLFSYLQSCLYVPLLCVGALDLMQAELELAMAMARDHRLAVLAVHAGHTRRYDGQSASAAAFDAVRALQHGHAEYQLTHHIAADARVVRLHLETHAWDAHGPLPFARFWVDSGERRADELPGASRHQTQQVWLKDLHRAEAFASSLDPPAARTLQRQIDRHAEHLQLLRGQVQPILDRSPLPRPPPFPHRAAGAGAGDTKLDGDDGGVGAMDPGHEAVVLHELDTKFLPPPRTVRTAREPPADWGLYVVSAEADPTDVAPAWKFQIRASDRRLITDV